MYDPSRRNLKRIEDEQWKPIEGTGEEYWVSSYGRIKSFKYDPTNGTIIRTSRKGRYREVKLRHMGEVRREYLHRIMAEAWVPKPSPDHDTVIIKDNNPKHLSPQNLQWVTQEGMRAYYSTHFTERYSSPSRRKQVTNSHLSPRDITHIRGMIGKGIPMTTISRLFRITPTQVKRIKTGECWGFVKNNSN